MVKKECKKERSGTPSIMLSLQSSIPEMSQTCSILHYLYSIISTHNMSIFFVKENWIIALALHKLACWPTSIARRARIHTEKGATKKMYQDVSRFPALI